MPCILFILNLENYNLYFSQYLEEVFEILDPEGMKLLDYVEFVHGIIGEMNEYRKALVRKVGIFISF